MAETPEQKYNRIAAAVQQTILTNFPNPSRQGCPGDARVRAVAARQAIIEDGDWQHITHCSECYREFLAEKNQIRRSGRRARTLALIGGTALLIILAGLAGYRYFGGPRPGRETVALSFEPATLNLRDTSEVRGNGKTSVRAVPSLPRRPLELTVILPFGSEPGAYQFQFVDANGVVVRSGETNAAVVNGDTALSTHVDLRGLTGGDYRFGLRREPFNWVLTPIMLR